MGDFQRARGDRRQHGVEIERGGNRAADFLKHLQLVDRAREVAGAFLDLGLEAGIGFLQLAGHAVELVGEFFQLVAGRHIDAMAEIAGAQPPRAGAQRGDRDQHPARQQGAGEDRDHEAKADQQRHPHQLVADRRQRQRGRLLEEHEPAVFRHRGGCGQHGVAVGAGARHLGAAVRRQQRGDLRQRREILGHLGALGRTRQHLAARIDHIGERRLADLRLAEEIRQKTQIDVGEGDAGIEAGMRHRDRHQGPPTAEIGGREADAAGHRFGEADVAGKIGAATDQHRGARQPKLLAAAAVQQAELVDRRYLVQQLGVVGAVLVQRVGAGAGHPADLALQFGERLLDPPRGRFRLLAHGIGQRGLGGAVADPAFHRPVHGQHENHQPNQRDDVFGEQALAEKPDFVPDPDHPDPRKRRQSRCRVHGRLSRGLFSTIRRVRPGLRPRG